MINFIEITINHVNFIIALTESSPVYLKALIACVFVHFVYYITILMLSGLSPSSDTSSFVASSAFCYGWFCSYVFAPCPYGLTGVLNWSISLLPVCNPSIFGFPKIIYAFSDPGDFQTSGSSILKTNWNI